MTKWDNFRDDWKRWAENRWWYICLKVLSAVFTLAVVIVGGAKTLGFADDIKSYILGSESPEYRHRNNQDSLGISDSLGRGSCSKLSISTDSSVRSSISIYTEPRNAKVYIDDCFAGRSNRTLDLPRGRYRIRIDKKGYHPVNDVINLPRDTYSAELKPIQ